MTEDFKGGLKQLVSLQRPADAICILDYRGFWVVAVAFGSRLRLYSFSQSHVEFSRRASHEAVQDLQGSRPFSKLFRAEGRAFALDVSGGVHWLCPQDDDEADIFDTEAITGCTSWGLVSATDTPVLPTTALPLAACPLGDDFIIIAAVENETLLYFGSQKVHLSNNSASTAIAISVIPDSDFSARWLSCVSGPCGFIGLSDGTISAFHPSLKHPLLLSVSVHAVRALHFDCPRLLALLENGSLVTLSPGGENISFPLPPLLDICILTPLAASDSLRLLVTKSSIRLAGITGLVPASGDRFGVLTVDGIWLAHAGRLASVDPISCISTINQPSSLAAAAVRLRAHAAILSARSLAARPLRWLVKIRVAQLLENRCVLRTKLTLDSPGVSLPVGWSLQLTVEGSSGVTYKGDSLLSGPLVSKRCAIIPVVVTLPEDVLIAIRPSLHLPGAPPLKLPDSLLDVSHFLQPPLSVLSKPSIASQTTIVLPTSSPVDLLSSSRPLWRMAESAAPPGPVMLFNHPLHITPSDDRVVLSGNDPLALIALKVAVLLKNSPVNNEDILLELVGWYQAIDILRYSPSDPAIIAGVMHMIKDTSRYSPLPV